jgi:predicted transcriptional regulator of viral defense system
MADGGSYIFSAAQAHAAARKLGIPAAYEAILLSSLVKGRWVQRLRRGLYAFADMLVPPFAIATRLVEPSAISHWSALNYHGLTEQIPQSVFALTPNKVVTPSMRAGAPAHPEKRHVWHILGVRYHYVTVKPEFYFGIEPVWISENFRVPMTDKERTILETFASPRLFGGIGEALSLVDQHMARLDLKRLIEYAVRYRKVSVAKRLGWALERAGIPQRTLSPLRKIPMAGLAILDPTRPRGGPVHPTWHIRENLAGKKL